ncbi:hypothetical protein [Aurantiacibacter spongiae]|uniref:Uncharacterized protein n=1 Tax=Aurantiacibacter spongiae TaxID=2488860 RepID=A0A3N5CRN9_9SPHN|nr:hypothetical protein [Aurantiacibacter spongiae]RPF71764.1 hypothetical protein EG799_09150 [Aurantiacibacter spongiae]
MSRSFTIGCTVQVENHFDALGAHVTLDGDVALAPGDRVLVHGPPITVPFGESLTERRDATVRRAGPLRAFWARRVRQWELHELYEVGFEGRNA